MQLERNVKQPTGQRKSTPILLVHGAWHAAWCYDQWMDEFAAHGYETHSFSFPAHGSSISTRSIHLYGIQDYVEALAQVIDSIQPTPYVIAHSLGGYVLQRYLQTHPLPAAVLLCALPNTGVIPFYLRYFRAHPLRYLAASLTLNMRRLINTPALVNRYLITEDAACTPAQLLDRIEPESLRAAVDVLLPIRKLQTQTPLLVVAAERDGIFMVAEEKRMAARYQADFLFVPGQGHNLMMERGWQQTAANIWAWLDKHQTNPT